MRREKLELVKDLSDLKVQLSKKGKEEDPKAAGATGTFTPGKKMFVFLASDLKRWKNWFLELPALDRLATGKVEEKKEKLKVMRYLDQSLSLPVVTMQFFNSFPGMYISKNKDMVRKVKASKEIIYKLIEESTPRWKAEAEEFRQCWLTCVESMLAKNQPLDRRFKRKVLTSVPVFTCSESLIQCCPTIGEMKETLLYRARINIHNHKWQNAVAARMVVFKVLGKATLEAMDRTSSAEADASGSASGK